MLHRPYRLLENQSCNVQYIFVVYVFLEIFYTYFETSPLPTIYTDARVLRPLSSEGF